MSSFTVESLFNRDKDGYPIGKGYIFASQNLEDLQNSKRFLNRLKLWGKDWTPSESYIASEPIGMFDLDKEKSMTVALLPQFQREYNYVKLLPIGFRKGPINF